MSSKFICPLPWISLSLGAENVPRLCCHQDISLETEMNDLSGTLVKREHTLRARTQMLNGEIPRECQSCHNLETAGCSSPRLEYLQRFNFDPGKAEAVKYLDLTPDNDCNLECVMCSPVYSQKLTSFYEKVYARPPQKQWESKFTTADLDQLLPHLEMVTVAGGETLLSSKSLELIRHLALSEKASSMKLRLFTNLSRIPDGLMDELARFGEVQFIVSIDSVGENYELMRFPAKWDRLLENLKLVKKKKSPGIGMQVHTVITAVNWPYMGELIRFFREHFSGSPCLLPSFVEIDERSLLHPRNLPESQWEGGKKKFLDALNELTPDHSRHQNEIEQVMSLIKKMEGLSMSHRFMDFKLFMEKIKAHRIRRT